METLLRVLQYSLAAYTACMVFGTIWSRRREWQFVCAAYARLRVGMALECVVALLVVGCLAQWLSALPVLRLSWSSFVYAHETNITLEPLTMVPSEFRWLVPLLGLVLLGALPFFVHAEELAFRNYGVRWGQILPRSLFFGLMHLVPGVSIGTCLALALGGVFFGWKYRRAHRRWMTRLDEDNPRSEFATSGEYRVVRRRFHVIACEEALLCSESHHLCYNTIAVVLICVFLTIR